MEIIISVIMGVYNSRNKNILELSIKSIINQSFKEWELIIYNDGSNEEVSGWLAEIVRNDNRIILIEGKKNFGLSYALNMCLKVSKGKYIARMDDDDISLPERFSEQYLFLEKHNEYSFVGCNAYLFENEKIWAERKMVKQPLKTDLLFNSPFIHPTILVRKEVYLIEGGYNTHKYCTRVEDYELFLRFYEKGYRGYNLQSFLFCYREDKDSYKKKKYIYRINEAKVRYRGFKNLGLLPKGIFYVLKPLVVGVMPPIILKNIKKRYSINLIEENIYEKGINYYND